MTLVLEDPVFEELSEMERVRAVSALALLLLEASGAANEEEDDENR